MADFTDIRITIIEKDSLRAMATCKAGGILWLTGIRVIEGSKGLFVSMPSRKTAAGEFQDVFFPASREVREELQKVVLAEYQSKIGGSPAASDDIPFEPQARGAAPARTPSASR